ncbi:MAG TPA: DUF6797 domain-containing protein, partial [Planctomycetota bacterium]|nr:DUF6797 domain-containing protein [Planctomycetota bacterium]
AWDGGWLELLGPPFEGSRSPDEKTRPRMRGTLRMATHNVPGVLEDDGRDPRPEPYGPLPATLAKYRGLYVCGDRVVFSYQAGACDILDLPGYEKGSFTRTLRLGPSAVPVILLVGEAQEVSEPLVQGRRIVLGSLAAAATLGEWKVLDKTRLYLEIPAHERDVLSKVVFGGDAEAAGAVDDPLSLTKGGPARYPGPVLTKGTLGSAGGAYEVDTLTAPDENPWQSWLRFTGLDFFSDGRAALCTWSGDVWIVSGIDASLGRLSWRRYATGLFQPCGLRVVDDRVYVVARDQITVFRDLNGDGEADYYENFNNDCTEKGNYHEFAMDLNTDPQGNFYYAKGGLGANFPGGPVAAHHGCFLKVSKDGKRLEVVATGLRAAAGSGVGPKGELTASDNDGHWGPASRINWVMPGRYYGDPFTAHRNPAPADFEPPLCWIHRSVDNSSGGEVWVTGGKWGPFEGHMLHLSYGTCSLFNVLPEEVGGRMQGGIVRFPVTFASGVLRGRFHPLDGQFYAAGLRGWSTSGTREGCLQRVRYTGQPARMVSGMHVRKDAIELSFTDPVDPASAGDPESWIVQQWNYRYTGNYGSADYSVADPKKQGRDPVDVASIAVSADGRTVTLSIPGLQPVMQMLIKGRIKAADGTPLSPEVWNTIHTVPR